MRAEFDDKIKVDTFYRTIQAKLQPDLLREAKKEIRESIYTAINKLQVE